MANRNSIPAASTDLSFRHVNVFASRPLSGNCLTFVITDESLAGGLRERLTVKLGAAFSGQKLACR